MKLFARHYLAFAGVIGAALMAPACGGGGKTLNDAGTFCQDIAKSRCGWARNCCELTEMEALLNLTRTDAYAVDVARKALQDETSCEDLVHAECVAGNQTLLDSMQAGRVKFQQTAFDACTKAYDAASKTCDIGLETGLSLAQTCDQTKIFTGTVAANSACFHPLDCKAGNTCWMPKAGSSVGICRPLVAMGQPCHQDETCAASSACEPDDQQTSVCSTPDTQKTGDFCVDDSLCADDAFCDTTAEKCTAKGAGSAACHLDKHCLSGRCNTDLGTCEAQGAKGASCMSDASCQSSLWCDSSGASSVCTVPLSTGKPGDLCSTAAPCRSDLICSGGTCRSPLNDGDLCTTGAAACGANSYCNPASPTSTTGTCAPRKAAGVTCTSTPECGTTLYCSGGTCKARIAQGEACVPYLDSCAAGSRCDTTTSTCSPLLGAGKACSSTADCGKSTSGAAMMCTLFAGQCNTRLTSGALCNSSGSCPATQYCNPGAATTGNSVCTTVPLAAVGEACTSTAQCETGLYCGTGSGTGLTCRTLGTVGSNCTSDPQCSTGLFCSTSTYTCTTKGTAGATCTTNAQCADTYYCNQTYPYSCAPYATSGETCSTATYGSPKCGPGLKCTASITTPVTYSCVAAGAAGAVCSYDTDCTTGLLCMMGTTGYQCTAKITEGGSCLSYPNGCADTLRCVNSVCTAPKPAGQACATTADCLTGLACQTYLGACAARTGESAQCLTTAQCTSGLECTQKMTCKALAKKGETCTENLPCAASLRCDPEWGKCIDIGTPVGVGEHCQVDAQCKTGACSNGICVGACQGIGTAQ